MLSIIIPTLNEEKYIEKTLRRVYECASGKLELEIIIVDTGSTDKTVQKVNDFDLEVKSTPLFKGCKYKALNCGANLSRGNMLMFLDADCLVPKDFDLEIFNMLNTQGIVAGAFEYSSDDRSITMRFIERLNHFRYRLTPDYFGDQGIFCTKEVFDKIEGFPEQPIMEAAFFCRRLKGLGGLGLVRKPIISSARRFTEGGILQVMYKDTWIWIQFLLGMNISRYASQYWIENQKRGMKKKF